MKIPQETIERAARALYEHQERNTQETMLWEEVGTWLRAHFRRQAEVALMAALFPDKKR